MRRELEYRYEGEGTRKYIDILLLFTRWPVEAVHQAVSICVKRRAFSGNTHAKQSQRTHAK